MRASKLITLSAVAVLAGGTSFALGHSSQQSGSSVQGSSSAPQSIVRGFEQKRLPGARGQKSALHMGALQSQRRRSIGTGAYARASTRELGEATTGPGPQERSGITAMMREIPRLSSVGTAIRIDAVVPRRVLQAAVPLPPEVQRLHPRLRRDRAFMYGSQVVIINPTTSRIVALFKA
jgi:hypothetical protein